MKKIELKGNHPLAEIIARKLFGISGCPIGTADRMINSACKEVVKYHLEEINVIRKNICEAIEGMKTCCETCGAKLRVEKSIFPQYQQTTYRCDVCRINFRGNYIAAINRALENAQNMIEG